ncbi:MAG: hypothetical protein ABIA21_01445 [Candidatus Aenigmatarchaeota archaeon]
MSPLRMDIYDNSSNKWIEIRRLDPGDKPASLSNTRKDGRDVYLIECSPDGTKSFVYRMVGGVDAENDDCRIIMPDEDREVVAILGKNGKSHELTITTSQGANAKLRFTHE